MKLIRNFVTRDKIKSELEQLDYQPDSFEELHNLASRQVIGKDWYSCLDTLDKIGEIHEVTSELLLQKGICNYRIGDISNAINCCEESLNLDETNEDSAKLLQKLQDRLKSVRAYTMLVYG